MRCKITTSFIFFIVCLGTILNAMSEKNTETISPERKASIRALAKQQDELQADLDEIISDQTDEEVIKLLNLCHKAMNDAIDLLDEQHKTDGDTLAAQSDVIEQIFQALLRRMGDGDEPGKSNAIMEMIAQMLGFFKESDPLKEQVSDGSEDAGNKEGDKDGNQQDNMPGTGNKGRQGAFENYEGTGESNPDAKVHERTVPKSSGINTTEIPEEFRKVLEHYNKTLQQ